MKLKFMAQQAKADRPFFTTIWYGSPHFNGGQRCGPTFADLKEFDHHYGELVALDRSVGPAERPQELGIAGNSFWYCSDNGGLKSIRHLLEAFAV